MEVSLVVPPLPGARMRFLLLPIIASTFLALTACEDKAEDQNGIDAMCQNDAIAAFYEENGDLLQKLDQGEEPKDWDDKDGDLDKKEKDFDDDWLTDMINDFVAYRCADCGDWKDKEDWKDGDKGDWDKGDDKGDWDKGDDDKGDWDKDDWGDKGEWDDKDDWDDKDWDKDDKDWDEDGMKEDPCFDDKGKKGDWDDGDKDLGDKPK